MNLFIPSKPEMLSEPVSGILEVTKNRALWVKYAGTSWSAQLYHPNSQKGLSSGQLVKIIGIQGNTLLIAL
jgi:membrane protein implicated in regulation of membrane protease activity